jgi:hypothetical protein
LIAFRATSWYLRDYAAKNKIIEKESCLLAR